MTNGTEIMATAAELEIIRGIIAELAPDCEVLVFGSRHSGKAGPYSDIDLAFVAGEGKLGLRRCLQLQDAFAESDLPYRVDVLDYHAVSPEFRALVDRGNRRITPEANPPATD